MLPPPPMMVRGHRNPWHFSSLSEAASSLNYQHNLMHDLRRKYISRRSLYPYSPIPFDMEQKWLALVAQLPRWPPTMGELWNRTASRGEIDYAFHQRFCVLRMNFEMTLGGLG